MSTVEEKKIFRSALLTFVGLASIIFIVALSFCISTGNNLATILLSVVIIGVYALAAALLRSENKKE